MQYRFKQTSLIRIGKYPFPHAAAVKMSGVVQNIVTEDPGDALECWLARLHKFPRDEVGINDGNAKRREFICNHRLTAGDATGQSDAEGMPVHELWERCGCGLNIA